MRNALRNKGRLETDVIAIGCSDRLGSAIDQLNLHRVKRRIRASTLPVAQGVEAAVVIFFRIHA